ncbi:CMRF35-like molecule 8 [Micropterus salmoides]|uniref:CMRF35-like molecule 8 n=1 Tax=Micropterus salmoides TaxID=27706 RepID=UPI0018EB3A8A|nr:CMRF35-like molecule 8 [Micropterus salmoides]
MEINCNKKTDGCQRQFNQTAYRTAKTTIACDYTGNKYKFFCKQKGSICEDILSTKSSLKSNGTFTLTETNSNFSVSISNVSSHDAGVYWCGVETHEGSYRAALRKIQLKVNSSITNFTTFPAVGQNLTYWCRYPNYTLINKFICKGEDPSICEPLLSTQHNKTIGRFSMKEDKNKRKITITVRNVTTDDTGTYWCGAETTDKTRSNKFFHKLVMTVVSPAVSTAMSPTLSTSLVSSTQSTTESAENRGDRQVVIIVIVCVAVLLLFVLILIYKRFSPLKNTRNGAAAQHKKDHVYEEIQQTPNSGNKMNTIYATATFPQTPLPRALLQHQLPNSSDRVGGETVILKPSSAAYEYSTVNAAILKLTV